MFASSSKLLLAVTVSILTTLTDAATLPGTVVSQATYNSITHYTRYPFFSDSHTPGTATAPCSSYPYGTTLVKSINIAISDTQAQIFRDDSAKEFVLSVPGTESAVDAFSDIDFTLVPFLSLGVSSSNCPSCLVHMGFLDAWNSISLSVISTLQSSIKSYPSYTIKVAGHSLGGAIGALGAFSLKGLGLPISAAYTFGQPRTGNAAWANSVDKAFGASDSAAGSFFRVTHATDPVPQLPPQSFGSRHSRTEYWESVSGSFSAATTYQCSGQESPSCNDGVFILSRKISDHLTYSGVMSGGTSSCG